MTNDRKRSSEDDLAAFYGATPKSGIPPCDERPDAALDAFNDWANRMEPKVTATAKFAYGLFSVIWAVVCALFFLAIAVLALLFFPVVLIPVIIVGAWIVKANRRSTAAAVQRAVREELARRDAANGPL